MLTISKKELMERWDAMPQKLKEAVWSEYNADILWEICKREHLSENKTSVVATITGDVIMGFLLPEDLARRIAESLEINSEIANRIAEEINKKILEPIKEDIRQIYSPPKEKVVMSEIRKTPAVKKEKVISLETLDAAEKIAEQKPEQKLTEIERKIEIRAEIPKITKPIKEEKSFDITQSKPFDVTQGKPFDIAQGKPFILHEEKPVEEKIKAPSKPFSLPFKIFTTKPGPEKPPIVKARVEEPTRVVHYSESRTPLEPFGKEEVINLETLQPIKNNDDDDDDNNNNDNDKNRNKEEKPTQPKLEGNVVDLR